MVTMPYLLLGTVGFMVYRGLRQQAAAEPWADIERASGRHGGLSMFHPVTRRGFLNRTLQAGTAAGLGSLAFLSQSPGHHGRGGRRPRRSPQLRTSNRLSA